MMDCTGFIFDVSVEGAECKSKLDILVSFVKTNETNLSFHFHPTSLSCFVLLLSVTVKYKDVCGCDVILNIFVRHCISLTLYELP